MLQNRLKAAAGLATGAVLCLSALPLAQAQDNPSTNQTFEQVTGGMRVVGWYAFGTAAGNNVSNLQQLSQSFEPYGIAGTTVIQQEWERYQPFNGANFAFTPNSLNLTATLNGGVYPGGIDSGQIWSKANYGPGVTGYHTYAFRARMKTPSNQGAWPAFWLYSPHYGDGSEVDVVEFQNMKWQNQFDWSGYDHGPGAGDEFYSIKTNQYVWHPGVDFSAGYHDYEVVWTPDATYKYVDGQLVVAQHFQWTSSEPAQFGINLAMGSSVAGATGLQPTSANEFPAALQIQNIEIWAK